MNTGTQELIVNPTTGKETIRRRALCPVEGHGYSSQYLGVTEEGGKRLWSFRCLYNRHTFYAREPRDAPKSEAEVDSWLAAHRLSRISKQEVRKRGA